MGRLITVAACNLAQHALDFIGNKERIIESIVIAKKRKATYRSGPELEICGYGLLDHFYEPETYENSLEMLFDVLSHPETRDILLDIGLPIFHRGLRLNCRAIALNGRLLLLRPKLYMANDGNYRELRYFQPFQPYQLEEFRLPEYFHQLQGSEVCPIGDSMIETRDVKIGFETCEEMWSPRAPHLDLTLAGASVISNSSGSHHNLRKLETRVSLVADVISTQIRIGCDGDRLYYDGCAMIILNGNILAQGSQFSLRTVEVVVATVDLSEIDAYRSTVSRNLQAVPSPRYQQFFADCKLSSLADVFDMRIAPTPIQELRQHTPEEELSLAPACWMWAYLAKSKASGFLIPLSGGLDSASTATLVFSMCRLVCDEIQQGNKQVILDCQRIAGPYHENGWLPKDPRELCHSILHTVYLGMKNQSSSETRSRAQKLSHAIGSYHIDMDIDDVFEAQKRIVSVASGFEPRFRAHGGSNDENLVLQNIQARSRMVTAYAMAKHLPSNVRGRSGGSLLVLGSGNVDEALRGYYTKVRSVFPKFHNPVLTFYNQYDCSSADINPIGGISKHDLKRLLSYAEKAFGLAVLSEILSATPTAELEPITDDYVQSDEQDMGLSYAELTAFGKLRKEMKLAPYAMFLRLLHEWKDICTARETAQKVKHFFHHYAINRHKQTVLTPALHMDTYSVDDFYESYSYRKIDEAVTKIEETEKKEAQAAAERKGEEKV